MKRTFAAAALMLGAAMGTAQAELIYGLTSDQRIASFDSLTPGVIGGVSGPISGLAGGDSIVDIDVYPVTGFLYGLGSSTGNLYRINPANGVAVLDQAPGASVGSPLDTDFNPVADRLRIFSAGDQNYRLTPSTGSPPPATPGLVTADGTLAYGGGSPNPDLVGAAYTNNFDGTAATTLYSIDTGTDSLVIHSGGPQFSTLAAVGPLGVSVGSLVGFDISATGVAYVSNGNSLYTVNLASGELSSIGNISTSVGVASIAAATVPEPATLGVLGIGLLALLRRR